MRRNNLLALAAIFLAGSAHAAEGAYFKFSELLNADLVEELADSGVQLYWSTQTTPEFSEVARPDVYTRPSISLSPFGGSTRHCVDAFESTLRAMVDDARNQGYDAITNLRVLRDDKPSDDPLGFNCKPGYKTTEVSLIGSFAMTSVAMQRAAEAEQRSYNQPARSPSAGAIFLPLEPILNSAEAKAILGSDIKAYWGTQAPAYSQHYGPEDYSDEADIGKLPSEEACKQAVLKTLSAMVQEAKTRNFDSIIKIRSFLDEQFAPAATDLECHLDKKTASVTLRSTLASKN